MPEKWGRWTRLGYVLSKVLGLGSHWQQKGVHLFPHLGQVRARWAGPAGKADQGENPSSSWAAVRSSGVVWSGGHQWVRVWAAGASRYCGHSSSCKGFVKGNEADKSLGCLCARTKFTLHGSFGKSSELKISSYTLCREGFGWLWMNHSRCQPLYRTTPPAFPVLKTGFHFVISLVADILPPSGSNCFWETASCVRDTDGKSCTFDAEPRFVWGFCENGVSGKGYSLRQGSHTGLGLPEEEVSGLSQRATGSATSW